MNVKNIPLVAHPDSRGTLTELFRQEWFDGPCPLQWNMVQSEANVLRGVHLHVAHVDYLVLIKGHMEIGLSDLRGEGESDRTGSLVSLTEENMSILMVPPGVAHGFYFPEPTTYFYGVSDYWDPVHDEYGCRWNDPELGIPWRKDIAPVLSERDEAACSQTEMLNTIRADGFTSC